MWNWQFHALFLLCLVVCRKWHLGACCPDRASLSQEERGTRFPTPLEAWDAQTDSSARISQGLSQRQDPAAGAPASAALCCVSAKSKWTFSSPASEFIAHSTCQGGFEGRGFPLNVHEVLPSGMCVCGGGGVGGAGGGSLLGEKVVFSCFPFQFGSTFTSRTSKFVQLWRLTWVCSFQ